MARGEGKRSWLHVALIIGAVLTLVGVRSASAEPVIDGLFDQSEGYTTGWDMDLDVEGKGKKGTATLVPGGELWIHEDSSTGNVSVLFSQPLTLIDNSYGANAIGWGKGVAPSGKNHNFKDLLGSDKAQFTFTDGHDNVVLDVVLDYLTETSKDSGVYASLGVTGGDGQVLTGLGANVLEWGTSMAHNMGTFASSPSLDLSVDSPGADANYVVQDPNYAAWQFQVIYELKVSGDAFADNGFSGVTVPIVHDSPNKIGGNKVYPIPEPATLSLVVLGGLGLAIRKRRR